MGRGWSEAWVIKDVWAARRDGRPRHILLRHGRHLWAVARAGARRGTLIGAHAITKRHVGYQLTKHR